MACEFVTRFTLDKPIREGDEGTLEKIDRNTMFMLFGLMFSSTVIFIRCVTSNLPPRKIGLKGYSDRSIV